MPILYITAYRWKIVRFLCKMRFYHAEAYFTEILSHKHLPLRHHRHTLQVLGFHVKQSFIKTAARNPFPRKPNCRAGKSKKVQVFRSAAGCIAWWPVPGRRSSCDRLRAAMPSVSTRSHRPFAGGRPLHTLLGCHLRRFELSLLDVYIS